MKERHSRTALLIGESGVEKLNTSRVLVFGAGGVGGQAIEALARAGVGTIGIVDGDCVSESNLNRQIIAVEATIGMQKCDAAEKRIKEIDSSINVEKFNLFYTSENANQIDLSKYDYIIDAIDTVKSKIELIKRAKNLNIPIISSMSAGNRLDITRFKVTDIYQTSVCPIARILRGELKKAEIKDLKVVYSDEPSMQQTNNAQLKNEKTAPASISFVPAAVGLILAGEVIKDLI